MRDFGRPMLKHWFLDPKITYLNHGTVGAPPRRVLEAQQAIRDEIERQPSRFILRELTSTTVGVPRSEKPRMRAAADDVAEFVGARGEDLAFVANATTGVDAVLRSLALNPGDEILILNHGYGAIAMAAGYFSRQGGASVETVELPYPVDGPGAVVDSIARVLSPRTRVAIIDHVTSESALVLPLAEIVACCRRRGVPVLVDGAHAPGGIPLDIPTLGVDWYSANLHKWAHSPRSCGFLWVAPDRQARLHAPVISWGLGKGFLAEFDWTGTRDPSAFLAAPAGIAFMRDLGLDAIFEYNHRLAWHGATLLSEQWGVELGMGEAMVGSMATIQLPERLGSTPEDAALLRDALLFEDRIEVQLHAWRGHLWVRISAQIYNDFADIERLGQAISRRR